MDTTDRLRGIRQRLSGLRMPELKVVLIDLNLPRSGRKSELIERIVEALHVSPLPTRLRVLFRFAMPPWAWALRCIRATRCGECATIALGCISARACSPYLGLFFFPRIKAKNQN